MRGRGGLLLSPETNNELHWFAILCAGSGITEELLYRGFLIFYISSFVPHFNKVALVLVVSAVFGLMHVYQGWRGVTSTAVSGLLLTTLYVVTGRPRNAPSIDCIRASSSWSVNPSSSMPVRENRHPYPPPLSAKTFGPMKREIGTMLHAAPALANHGVCLYCSVFARVIVGLLVEAEAPESEHLWVFTDDEPCTNRERRKGHHRQQAKPNEENRYADEYDRHLSCKIEAKFGSRSIQRLIDR
jgi:hypothetical protein